MPYPIYKSLAYDKEGAFLTGAYAADNAVVFAKATAYETPADWWYLKNKEWIDDWARVLNSDVKKRQHEPFGLLCQQGISFHAGGAGYLHRKINLRG